MSDSKFELREGSALCFYNDKRTSDRAPEYKGECLYKGEKVEVAVWRKEGKRGTYLSVAIKPAFVPDASKRSEQPQQPKKPGNDWSGWNSPPAPAPKESDSLDSEILF